MRVSAAPRAARGPERGAAHAGRASRRRMPGEPGWSPLSVAAATPAASLAALRARRGLGPVPPSRRRTVTAVDIWTRPAGARAARRRGGQPARRGAGRQVGALHRAGRGAASGGAAARCARGRAGAQAGGRPPAGRHPARPAGRSACACARPRGPRPEPAPPCSGRARCGRPALYMRCSAGRPPPRALTRMGACSDRPQQQSCVLAKAQPPMRRAGCRPRRAPAAGAAPGCWRAAAAVGLRVRGRARTGCARAAPDHAAP